MFVDQKHIRSDARGRLYTLTPDQPAPTEVQDSQTAIELYLASRGQISADDMMRTLVLSQRTEATPSQIMTRLGMIEEEDLIQSEAARLRETYVDLDFDPPDATLIRRWGTAHSLRTGLIPWRMRNGCTVVVTSDPAVFDTHKTQLENTFGPVRRAFATDEQIKAWTTRLHKDEFTARAEQRVTSQQSCRTLNFDRFSNWLAGAGTVGVLCAVFAPKVLFIFLAAWAILALALNTFLRTAAAIVFIFNRNQSKPPATAQKPLKKLPQISVLVPLFQEKEIAGALIKRLARLQYPRELLDVIIVLEEDDAITRQTIARTQLPRWMRSIVVPPGGLKTKPRAMNYALDHCKGSIIGIYDAEDAPDPYQLKRIARRFSEVSANTACLQGVLDFYNPRENWLSRCFTIEYATWFRLVLPGLQKMGLAVPLGGTTLFIKRDVLEQLGAWDAHNVTEDADLGIRLARYGYRTQMIPTPTYEEANCRPWPWVRQRSRWLKGFAITWAVHMRDPLQLIRDVGLWKFFGIQVLFFGMLSGFTLAPVLWTFWLAAFGLPHPMTGFLPHVAFVTLGALFLLSEILVIATGMLAVSDKDHRHLLKWVPSLHFYFPMATLAMYKALWELVTKPFYWDKTSHGVSHVDDTPQKIIPQPHEEGASHKPDLNAAAQLHTQLLDRVPQSL
ncbi:MAG: glycosyltransferase [Planktomarina sp.]